MTAVETFISASAQRLDIMTFGQRGAGVGMRRVIMLPEIEKVLSSEDKPPYHIGSSM